MCICHTNLIQTPTWGLAFCDNVFIFSQWPGEPQAVSTAGKPRGFISVVHSSLESLPGSLLWRAMQKRVQDEVLHQLCCPSYCAWALSTSPAVQLRGEGPAFHRACPKLCRPRTVSPFAHVCVSGGQDTCELTYPCVSAHAHTRPVKDHNPWEAFPTSRHLCSLFLCPHSDSPIDALSPPLNWQIFLTVPHRPGT